MHGEEMKGWIRETKRKKEPVRSRIKLLVRLIQIEFGDGYLSEELA